MAYSGAGGAVKGARGTSTWECGWGQFSLGSVGTWSSMVRGFCTRSSWTAATLLLNGSRFSSCGWVPVFGFHGGELRGFGSGAAGDQDSLLCARRGCVTWVLGGCLQKETRGLVKNKMGPFWTGSAGIAGVFKNRWLRHLFGKKRWRPWHSKDLASMTCGSIVFSVAKVLALGASFL